MIEIGQGAGGRIEGDSPPASGRYNMPLFDILTQVDGQSILWAGITAGNTTHAREIIEAHLREEYREPNAYVMSVTPTKERRGNEV